MNLNPLKTLAALAALCSILSGCATSGGFSNATPEQKASLLAPALSASVAGAVVYAHSKDPDAARYLMLIGEVLNQFALEKELAPAKLQAALSRLPVKELKTVEAQLIMAPILAAYGAFYDQRVKEGIDANPSLRILIRALAEGLRAGEEAVQSTQHMAAQNPHP